MKTIIEILDDCVIANAPIKPDANCKLVYRIVGTGEALEAMKIAMKQAFETGYYFGNRYGYTDEELTFDEWFKGLEEKK